jgi:lipoate-protein ligase A
MNEDTCQAHAPTFPRSHVQTLRVIHDSPADGPTNMARDESLLTLVGRGESPPTLRFYRWEPATISLGYFQPHVDYERLEPPAGNLAVVRRQTGGGAILHDLELTYSIVLPLTHPLVAHGRCNCLYEHVHSIFAAVLSRSGVPVKRGPLGGGAASHRGPFFCFERHSHYDLLVDGAKLLGSAQRRTADAVLQHGSLVLDCRFGQWKCATVKQYAPAFRIDEHLPTIARAIATGCPASGEWTADELRLADELRGKYAGDAWTRAR